MFEKSKTAEMQRLRAAGFTLANADRLSRKTRGPGLVVAGSAVVAVLLAGGIVALGFDITRQIETAQTPQAVDSAAPSAPATRFLTEAADPADQEALGTVTLRALQQNRISQSLSVQEAAAPRSVDEAEEATRRSGGISATLDSLTTAAINATPVTPVLAAAPAAEVTPDCVADLTNLLRDVNLPFGLSSSSLPAQSPEILSKVVADLNACQQARLMITGHSDSTGPEFMNIQISWQRADATMSRLMELGAAPDQLEVIGFGTRVPFTADTATDAPENRRVDFRVLRREEPTG